MKVSVRYILAIALFYINMAMVAAPLTALVHNDTIKCFGDQGKVWVTASGGVKPYHYQWKDQSGHIIGGDSDTLTAYPGDYNVTVIDSKLPTHNRITKTAKIYTITPLDVNNVDYANIMCHNIFIDTIVISPTGGARPYKFSTDSGKTFPYDSLITNLNPGFYYLAERDNHNCIFIDHWDNPIPIVNPKALLIDSIDTISVTVCFGNNNGEIIVHASGGTGTLTYSLYKGAVLQSSDTIGDFKTLLAAANYKVTVDDINSCGPVIKTNIVISQPGQLNASQSMTAVSPCSYSNNGKIKVFSPIGGSGKYQASVDTGKTWKSVPATAAGHTFTGLLAGTYAVQLRDSINPTCFVNLAPLTITAPQALSATIVKTDLKCYKSNDGKIQFTNPLPNPSPTKTYSINGINYQIGTAFSSLSKGSFSLFMRYLNPPQCPTSQGTVTLNQPDSLILSTTKTDVKCKGGSDGSITASGSGGTHPYTFTLKQGATVLASDTIGSFTGLLAGNYTVNLTDKNNCGPVPPASVTIGEPAALTVSITPGAPSTCPSTNLTLNGQPRGGNGGYISNWTGAGAVHLNKTNDSLVVFNWNIAGNYNLTYTVTDQKGCTQNGNVTVIVNVAPVATATNNGPVCAGTTLSLTGGPGGMTSYSWTGPNGFHSVLQSPTVSANATVAMSGKYILTVTNASMCTDTASTTAVVRSAPNATATNNGPVCIGTTLSLTGGPNGMTTYAWTGPNSFTSTLQSPTVSASATLAMAGVYTITVTDGFGCTKKKNTTVVVNSLPVPTATNNGPVCSGSPLTLTGGPGGLTTYSWTGPNGFTSTLQSPTVSASATAAMSGQYILTATNSKGCHDTASTTVVVNAKPVPTATNNGPVCAGTTLSLTGGPNGMTTYSWTGPNGYISALQSPTVSANATAAMSGTYTLTVTDGNGCQNTASTIAIVNALPVVTATNNGPVCVGTTLSLTGGPNGMTTYSWAGPNGFISAIQSPTVSASATLAMAGTYTLTATDGNGCTNSNTTIVIVNSLPVPTATNNGPVCAGLPLTLTGGPGGMTSYSWTGPNGFISAVQSPTVSANATAAMAGTYTLTVTDSHGCQNTANTVVVVNAAPVATAANNGPVCAGTTLSLTGGPNGMTTYSWTGPNGYISALQSPTVSANTTVAMSGTYTLTVTDGNGCQNTASTIAIVNALPVVTATNNGPVCVGTTLSLTGGPNGMTTYSWAGPNGFISAIQSPTVSASATLAMAGTYTLTVTDGNGCTNSNTTIVIVNSLPVPTATNNGPVCAGSPLTLTGGPGGMTTYSWTGPNSYTNTLQSPTVSANATAAMSGTYTLTVIDGNGCTNTANTVVVVNAPPVATAANNGPVCAGTTLSLTGGANGMTSYSWTGPNSFISVVQSPTVSANATAAMSGTYTLTVTDGNGCSNNTTTDVTVNSLPINNYNVSDAIACFFSNANIGVSGSEINTTYNLKKVTDHSTISGPVNGTGNAISFNINSASIPVGTTFYYVEANSIAGCISDLTDTAKVTKDSNITINVTVLTNVLCHGDSTGSLKATITGGTLPYSYSLSGTETRPAQLSDTFKNLLAGVYQIKITDSLSCSKTSNNKTITEPATALVLQSADTTGITCNGNNDGLITAVAIGGTPPRTYSLLKGGVLFAVPNNTGIFPGLPMGNDYIVTVTDANSCGPDTSATLIINEPAKLTLGQIEADSLTCSGYNDGIIKIKPSGTQTAGGTKPYKYFLKQGNILLKQNASGTFDSLAVATNYKIVVTDAHGCADSLDNIAIGAPDSIGFNNIIIQDITCFGDKDGFIHIFADGGLPPYTFSIDSGKNFLNNNGIFNNLLAGTYHLAIKDSRGTGCIERRISPSGEDSVFVFEPAKVTANTKITDVTCHGADNGEIDVINAQGGRGFLIFSIDSFTSFNLSGVFNPLNGGSYKVSVRDTNKCEWDSVVIVNEPALLAITSDTALSVSCPGNTDGEIIVKATGGNPRLIFTLNTIPVKIIKSDSIADFKNIPAGTYNVSVTDSLGCAILTTPPLIIGNPVPISIVGVDSTNLKCNGDPIGQIIVHATGGNAPTMKFSINGKSGAYQKSNIFNGLSGDLYDVWVKDTCDTVHYRTVNIFEPSAILVSSIDTFPVQGCHGTAGGKIIVNATGGILPLNYSIGGAFQLNDTFPGLNAGNYTITIQDDSGCQKTGNAIITEPAQLKIDSFYTTMVNGIKKGTLKIYSSGGHGPFTYSIGVGPDQPNNNYFTNLDTGTYHTKVTDFYGCLDTMDVYIADTLGVGLIVKADSAKCNGDSTGTLHLKFSGGTPPYTYYINNPATGIKTNLLSIDTTGFPAGIYTIFVSDSLATHNTRFITIFQPQPIVPAFTFFNATDSLTADGKIIADASGGTGTISVSGDGGTNYFPVPDTFSSLKSGNYLYKFKDIRGCRIKDTIVTLFDNSKLSIVVGKTDVACMGDSSGTVKVKINGGQPDFTITLQRAGFIKIVTTAARNYTFSGIPKGTNYKIKVTDINGKPDSRKLDIIEPLTKLNIDTIIVTPQVDLINPDGTLDIQTSGGWSQKRYSNNDGNNYSAWTSQFTFTYSGLPGDSTYQVKVEDSVGCIVAKNAFIEKISNLTFNKTITDEKCVGSNDGTVKIDILSGKPPYSYSSDLSTYITDGTSHTFSLLAPGTYHIAVADKYDTVFDTITINPATQVTIASLTATNANKFPVGTITVTPSGGKWPYKYSYNSKTSGSVNNFPDSIFTGLPADSFYVFITDTNLCNSKTDTIVVGLDTVLNVTVIKNNDVLCSHDSSGQLTLTALNNQGYVNYSIIYNLNNDTILQKNNGVFSNLRGDTFKIYVEDSIGQKFRGSVIIYDTLQLLTVTTKVGNPLCSLNALDSIQAFVHGGIGPFHYNWYDNNLNPVGTDTSLLKSIPAGTYSIDVTDANNCHNPVTVVAIIPQVFVLGNISTFNSLCNVGLLTGSILVDTPLSGTPPFHYLWSPPLPDTSIVDNLAPGNYKVKVTDNNGCSDSASVIISSVDTLKDSLNNAQATCSDSASISVKVLQGTPVYKLIYSSDLLDTIKFSDTLIHIKKFMPGSYDLKLIDSLNCFITHTIVLTGSPPVNISMKADTPSCQNTNDGSLHAYIASGTPSYEYVWEDSLNNILKITPFNNSTEDTLNNISLGYYKLVVTDGMGCSSETIKFSLPSKDTLSYYHLFDSIAQCKVPGGVQIDITNGTPKFRYKWKDLNDTIIVGNSNIIKRNMLAGNYFITVLDARNCRKSDTVNMKSTEKVQIDSINVTPETCLDSGRISISISQGVPPLQLIWNNKDTITHNFIKDTIIRKDLLAGSYHIDVTDDHGCESVRSFSVDTADWLYIDAGKDTTICYGTAYALQGMAISGKQLITSGATFTWQPSQNFMDQGNIVQNPVTLANPYNMYAVDHYWYYMSVSYGTGACVKEDSVKISYYPGNGVTLKHNDSVSYNTRHILVPVIGGTGGYIKYNWTPVIGVIDSTDTTRNLIIIFRNPVTYTFSGLTEYGCWESDTTKLIKASDIIPYNVFTPNGDGRNDKWRIPDAEQYEDYITVEVFNRWGQKVYQQTGYNNNDKAWDGTAHGKPLPIGTYYYVITISGEKTLTGTVTIMR